MNVVFLDIDGVLNSNKWYSNRFKDPDYEGEGKLFHADDFDPHAIALLNELSDCKIVLSTSWRFDYDATCDDLKFNGVKLEVIGATPYIPFMSDEELEYAAFPTRGKEIKSWLEHNKADHYVILDDENKSSFPYPLSDHLVHTNAKIGLTEADIEMAKQILTINNEF